MNMKSASMGAILNCWTFLLLAALLFGSAGCGPAIRMVTEEPRPFLFVGSVTFFGKIDEGWIRFDSCPDHHGRGPLAKKLGAIPNPGHRHECSRSQN